MMKNINVLFHQMSGILTVRLVQCDLYPNRSMDSARQVVQGSADLSYANQLPYCPLAIVFRALNKEGEFFDKVRAGPSQGGHLSGDLGSPNGVTTESEACNPAQRGQDPC